MHCICPHRGMTEEAGSPRLGETARSLGVRLGTDIAVSPGGLVVPGAGGMSVAPKTPMNLPVHRRPRLLLGTGRDPVWGIHESALGSLLIFHQDSPTHGNIEPALPMPFDNFQKAISELRQNWLKVVSGN